MDILIVGVDAPGALERFCARALWRLGHTIQFHDLYSHLIDRARFRSVPVLAELEFSMQRRPYNRALIQRAQDMQPDLVLVVKGLELYPATIEALRRLPGRPPVINWNPDSPFDDSASNSSPDLIAAIPQYDLYLTWDRDLIEPLRAAGARQVDYLAFAYDPEAHYPADLSADQHEELQSDVCFVGGFTPERARLLMHLTDFKLGIWGTNWEQLPIGSPLRAHLRGGWVTEGAMSEVFSAAKVVLNFIRPQNGQAHNMRTFEAPATRSLMVATYTRDQAALLPPGEAAAYFQTEQDLTAQVQAYLDRPAERDQMARTAYERLVRGGHSYDHRMQRLLELADGL